MSGMYGMAADHVMALEVVTADGRFVTASPTSHPDLYWALRGGGGSTFGVVTSIIIRVHPRVAVTTTYFTFQTSEKVSKETFWLGVRAYLELFVPFTDAGTYSYFWVYNNNGTFNMTMKPLFAPNYTIEALERLTKPMFDRFKDLGIPVAPDTRHYDDYYPAFNESWGNNGSIGSTVSLPGNRLFPRTTWEDPVRFNATFEMLKRHSEAGLRFGGFHQAPKNRANADNAVNSAFRHTVAFLIANAPVPENATPDQMRTSSERLTREILQRWHEVAPASDGAGSYLNEASVMEPDWQSSFYGTNYARLLEIKKKRDPKDVFYATTAVGSEFWEVRDGEQGVQTQNGRLCRL
jgi:hypothetical protein